MKRILRNVFCVILAVSMIFCASSCGDSDGMKRYSENGLNFALPKYLERLSVTYADLAYGNTDMGLEVLFYFLSSESLLTELYLQKDCTVQEYAEWFVNVNGYQDVNEVYDVENQTIVLEYIYEPEEIYFCDYILRNEYALFHMTMSSNAEDRELYSPIFAEWRTYVSLNY